MTQQRSNDDIRADLDERLYGHVGDRLVANARLALDVAPLLARVSELEKENAKLFRRLSDQERFNAASRKSTCEQVQALTARAERAEAGAAALLVKVAAVEALLPNTDEQFPIFPFQIREAIGADPSGYILIPVASLAAAGLSLQEEQE